jgi:ankyrin repeat protein
LLKASVKGHCDVVECLLSSGGEINLRNENGHSPLIAASCKGEYDVVKCLLSSGADINLCEELSKHSTTSQCPFTDAFNNGDCPRLSHKLISAPELSKHLTISNSPFHDATDNGEHPSSSHKCR